MGKFDVGIEALRQDVQIWDQQSGQMKQIIQKVDSLKMDRLEAGIFQIFISAYQDAVNEIVNRATEGSTAMSDVGATLTTVANEYQADETNNTYRFKDLH